MISMLFDPWGSELFSAHEIGIDFAQVGDSK